MSEEGKVLDQETVKKGYGVISLVLACVCFVLNFVVTNPIFGLVILAGTIASFVMGIKAIRRDDGATQAWFGVVISGILLLLAFVGFIIGFMVGLTGAY